MEWLVKHQNMDGGWGKQRSNIEETSNAILGLLYGGMDPGADTVRDGIQYLLNSQKGDGGWNGSPVGVIMPENPYGYADSMYAHSWAMSALAEFKHRLNHRNHGF
jgi:squalene-hopene/tetraprenyl-beta-curcumene cyclase